MERIYVRPTDCIGDIEMEPDFLQIYDSPMHVWIGEQHFIETTDRRVTRDKYYFNPNGEGQFQKVVSISEESTRNVPEQIDDVNNGGQEVTIEVLYEAHNDDPIPDKGTREQVPRYVLETKEPIGIGDRPQIPFIEAPEQTI